MSSNKNKDYDKILKDIERSTGSGNRSGGSLKNFFIGLLMLGAGLFMIFQNITVSSGFGGGYFFGFGSFHIPNGMIMLPLIVGIAMLFVMEKKIFGLIVSSIGVLVILLTVLLTTHIYWRSTSAYIFIIMFSLVAVGGALVLKELLRSK